TRFEWGWATVKLLANAAGDLRDKLNDVVDLHIEKTGHVENSAWSKRLGVSKDDALPWEEIGNLIAADPAIMASIRDIYNIKQRGLLDGITSFLDLKNQELQKAMR